MHATDLDVGEFGKITYFLERSTTDNMFEVDPSSGEVRVSGSLDRERRDNYALVVIAYDNYQFGFLTGDSRHAFTQVFVEVTDINDETPVFEEVSAACSSVSEYHSLGETVTVVRARDDDDRRSNNAKLSFSLVSGNEQGLFRIESSSRTSGRILASHSLKSHHGNYTVVVEAKDMGVPANAATQSYRICVQVPHLSTRHQSALPLPERAFSLALFVPVISPQLETGKPPNCHAHALHPSATAQWRQFGLPLAAQSQYQIQPVRTKCPPFRGVMQAELHPLKSKAVLKQAIRFCPLPVETKTCVNFTVPHFNLY